MWRRRRSAGHHMPGVRSAGFRGSSFRYNEPRYTLKSARRGLELGPLRPFGHTHPFPKVTRGSDRPRRAV